MKWLENYINKKVIAEMEVRASSYTTREDIEAMDIERERQREQLEEYKIVERIISVQTVDECRHLDEKHTEYLVKWKVLGYEGRCGSAPSQPRLPLCFARPC